MSQAKDWVTTSRAVFTDPEQWITLHCDVIQDQFVTLARQNHNAAPGCIAKLSLILSSSPSLRPV